MLDNKIDAFSKAFLAHDRRLRPLPRSQARRRLAGGLLRPRRRLHEFPLGHATPSTSPAPTTNRGLNAPARRKPAALDGRLARPGSRWTLRLAHRTRLTPSPDPKGTGRRAAAGAIRTTRGQAQAVRGPGSLPIRTSGRVGNVVPERGRASRAMEQRRRITSSPIFVRSFRPAGRSTASAANRSLRGFHGRLEGLRPAVGVTSTAGLFTRPLSLGCNGASDHPWLSPLESGPRSAFENLRRGLAARRRSSTTASSPSTGPISIEPTAAMGAGWGRSPK